MATRSRIAIELPDGKVKSIYCHWDGYPSNNGKILNESYTDREKVEALIELGDISTLGNKVEPEGLHSFHLPEAGVTVAYARDRGEKINNARAHASRDSFFISDVEQFGYLFTKEGEWLYVSSCDRNPRNIPRAVKPNASSLPLMSNY